MSKLNKDLVEGAIDKILAYSNGETIQHDGADVKGKKRKFVETIDLQIALKNYDPQRDKRFSGTFKLPVVPRPSLKCCIIGNAVHCEEAERIGVDKMSVDDLKKFNKNKKVIKKFAKKFDAFLASDTLIKQIPRLLGPGLTKAGKFPTLIEGGADLTEKIDGVRATIKFQMKKVMCLNVAVGNVSMEKAQIVTNVTLAANFLASLLKKNWQNIRVLYVLRRAGPPQQIFLGEIGRRPGRESTTRWATPSGSRSVVAIYTACGRTSSAPKRAQVTRRVRDGFGPAEGVRRKTPPYHDHHHGRRVRPQHARARSCAGSEEAPRGTRAARRAGRGAEQALGARFACAATASSRVRGLKRGPCTNLRHHAKRASASSHKSCEAHATPWSFSAAARSRSGGMVIRDAPRTARAL